MAVGEGVIEDAQTGIPPFTFQWRTKSLQIENLFCKVSNISAFDTPPFIFQKLECYY